MKFLSAIILAAKDNLPARALQVANIFRFLTSVLVGVMWIKMGVDKSIVGRLEFFLFLSIILSNFWIYGFKNGLLSYYEDLNDREKSNLFSSIFILLCVVGIGVGLLSWVMSKTILAPRLFDFQLSDQALLMAVFIAISIPASLGDYFLLLRSKLTGLVCFGSIFGLAQLFALVLPFFFGYGYIEALMCLVVVTAIKLVVTFLLSSPFQGALYDHKGAMIYLVFCVPLLLQVLLGFLQEFADGWIVSTFYEEEMFANYRYGARELPFSLILVSGLVASMIPAFKKNNAKALNMIKKESTRLIKLLFLTGTALIFLSPFLFELAYNDSFLISAQIFNVYILMLLSRVIFPHIVIYGYNKNWILPRVVLVELIINISLSLLLLPYFGILGVAFATIVANFVEKIIMAIYVDRKFGIKIGEYMDMKTYLIYSLILIAAFVSSHFIYI